MTPTAPLLAEFETRFGGAPRVFRAPGRVNLIGEHTDYMAGLCLPIAVDRAVTVLAAPRDDGKLSIHSTAFGSAGPFRLDGLAPPSQRAWHDLIRGIAAVLRRDGVPVSGANLLVDSDVPIGGGMSSSAAVAIASGTAMLALAGQRLQPLELALSAQAAETEFTGTRCGLLDPLAIGSARAGQAVLIDCRSRTTALVPFDAAAVLVFDTRTKRDLSGSGYNQRRAECEAGLDLLRRHAPELVTLRDVDPARLDDFAGRLPSPLLERVRHVVTENARVVAAVEALRRGDVVAFGALMFDSHRSLRSDCAVTTDELDWVVTHVAGLPGAYGAKMTGGGFGGCVVALVSEAALGDVGRSLLRGYEERFGTAGEAYPVHASDGAGEIAVGH